MIKRTKYSVEQIAKTHALYLAGTHTLKELADEVDVNVTTIQQWVSIKKWKAEKDEIQNELISNSKYEFLQHVSQERVSVARRHLEIAKLLEDRIKERLDGINPKTGEKRYFSVKDYSIMAKTLKDITEVSARAAGLNDKTFETMNTNGVNALNPIIVVGLQPRNVKENRNNVIDITEEGEVSNPLNKTLTPPAEDPF